MIKLRGILLDTTPSETLHVPAGAAHCVSQGNEYVLATEIIAEVREWAAYCRAVQPGPNLADTMLAFIGDPPHDYAGDGEANG